LKAAARHAHERNAYLEEAQLLEHTLCIAENMSEPDRRALEQEIEGELHLVRMTIGGSEEQAKLS